MNGPLPITYGELKAYAELMAEPLNPWEVHSLRVMDTAFIDEAVKVSRASQKGA